MKSLDIVHVLEIQAPVDKVYEAIVTERGLAGWWTTQAKAQAKVGAVNEFRFAPGMPTFRLRVDELDPGARVAWTPLEGPPDWQGTRIAFALAPGAQGASVRFTHEGFASAEGGFGVYSYSWAQFLRSLKLLCETGKGEPAGG